MEGDISFLTSGNLNERKNKLEGIRVVVSSGNRERGEKLT